jgi:hypothetical protein
VRADRRSLVGRQQNLFEMLGADTDVDLLASAIADDPKLMDALMETAPFWRVRMEQAQALVDKTDERWDAALSARIMRDYLLSQRDMAGLRVDFGGLDNAKPCKLPLLQNPHPTTGRQLSVVYHPEPFKPRSGTSGFGVIVGADDEKFGLEMHLKGEDCTTRDPIPVLQALINRDAHLLRDQESFGPGRPLEVVVGCDGADDFVHINLRLVQYMPGVAAESERKAACVGCMMGDDHNPCLQILCSTIAPAINEYIAHEGEVGFGMQLFGREVPIRFSTCLDYSAARSFDALRCNACPQVHTHYAPPMRTRIYAPASLTRARRHTHTMPHLCAPAHTHPPLTHHRNY